MFQPTSGSDFGIRFQIAAQARADRVKKRIIMDLNQEYAGFWEILKLLSDGKPKTWSEIQSRIELSQVTLSRRLKNLEKIGVLKRSIIPAFPPRTTYQLNHGNIALTNWLKSESKVLELKEQLTTNLIILTRARNLVDTEKTEDILDMLLQELEREVFSRLYDLLNAPLEKHPTRLMPIASSLTTLMLMHSFWTMYEALEFSEERRTEFLNVISQRMNELAQKQEKEIYARVLGK